MKHILSCFAVVFICACSHPIEIVGTGNVVTLNPPQDRGCSYQEYLAGSDRCTKNYVVGEYKVDYAADPAEDWPNWYFERWENYCTDDTLGECSFNLPAGVVQQFWGEAAPPLVAVFSERVGNPPPISKIVTVDGRQWLRPRLFSGVNWSALSTLCHPGPCSGELMGFDITGWHWASIEDVNALFNHYIGAEELGPGPDYYQRAGAQWLDDFWDDNWGQSAFLGFPPHVYKELWGLTRDCVYDAIAARDVARMGGIYATWDYQANTDYGIATTSTIFTTTACEDTSAGHVGAWLYRDPP